jgi:hypothetical protein
MRRIEHIELHWVDAKKELPIMICVGEGKTHNDYISTKLFFRIVEEEKVKTILGYYKIHNGIFGCRKEWVNALPNEALDELEFDSWEESECIEWASLPYQLHDVSLEVYSMENSIG